MKHHKLFITSFQSLLHYDKEIIILMYTMNLQATLSTLAPTQKATRQPHWGISRAKSKATHRAGLLNTDMLMKNFTANSFGSCWLVSWMWCPTTIYFQRPIQTSMPHPTRKVPPPESSKSREARHPPRARGPWSWTAKQQDLYRHRHDRQCFEDYFQTNEVYILFYIMIYP